MATLPESTVTRPAAEPALRLRLGQTTGSGGVGAWWPHSRDLQVEAAALLDGFPADVGRVNRLLMSRPDWDDAVVDGHGVRRIRAARGPVKIGSFPRDDTSLMILMMSDGTRLRLEVIPAATEATRAQRLLAAAGSLSARDDAEADLP